MSSVENVNTWQRKNIHLRPSKCARGVSRYFKEYCERTSLHGFQYIGNERASLLERFCWLAFLALSFSACVFLIRQIWVKWETSPVLVTFSGNTVSVSEVPFPAVTICSELKVDNSRFNLTEFREHATRNDTIEKKLSTLSLLCNNLSGNEDEEIGEEDIRFMIQIGTPCHKLLTFCQYQFRGRDDCEDYISPLLTEEGICCSFNMLAPQDMFTNNTRVFDVHPQGLSDRVSHWTLANGYTPRLSQDEIQKVYPRRGLGTGVQSGLRLTIEADMARMDRTCRSPDLGFKMAFHNPAEMPTMSDKYLKLPDNREFLAALTPSMITTLDNLRPYHPGKRGCFFPDERKLRFFKTYTQDNCEFECKVNLTRLICGCASFYMPRDENTPYCGPAKQDCVWYTTTAARLRKLYENPTYDELPVEVSEQFHECNKCLPACTEIKYDVQASHSIFDQSAVSSYFGESRWITRVSVFFREMQFIPTHRSELYGWTDFLANCGGILGLCLGFSVLSLIEILYFLTIRLALKLGQGTLTAKETFVEEARTEEKITLSHFAKRSTRNGYSE